MIVAVSPVQAGWFGPDNYDDCILENIKPGLSKHGAYAVRNSCRSKFSYTSGNGVLTFGNPDDCILEHVKLDMIRMSVSLIRGACNSKYKKKQVKKTSKQEKNKTSDLEEFRKTYIPDKAKQPTSKKKLKYTCNSKELTAPEYGQVHMKWNGSKTPSLQNFNDFEIIGVYVVFYTSNNQFGNIKINLSSVIPARSSLQINKVPRSISANTVYAYKKICGYK